MRTRFLIVAALAIAVAMPVSATPVSPSPKPSTAAQAIERLLTNRDALKLTTDQVTGLTQLATRAARERVRVAGLDRVPGKSVPRAVRERTSVTEAVRQALALLSTGQRNKAVELLKGLHA